MIITFMRQDENGNPVKVKIAKNDLTGRFIRIRWETTSLKYHNTLKSDFYWSEREAEEFQRLLDKEIQIQEQLLNELKNLSIRVPETQKTEDNNNNGGGRLAETARLLRMKREGQT